MIYFPDLIKFIRGSFYRDNKRLIPDSTTNGHEEQEDYVPKKCVQEKDKSPWGYHYHFKNMLYIKEKIDV